MLTKDQGKSLSAQQKLQAAILWYSIQNMNRIVFIYLLLSLSFIYCFFCSWPQWHMLFFCYDTGSIVLSHYHHPLSCTLHVVDSIERTLWRLTTSKVHSLGLKLAWKLENMRCRCSCMTNYISHCVKKSSWLFPNMEKTNKNMDHFTGLLIKNIL